MPPHESVKLLNRVLVAHNLFMHGGGLDLVGRQTDMAWLSRLLTGDSWRALVVSGDPGVGKTALIEQLCSRAVTDGWRVVRVLGVEAEESFSLGGLNQIVVALQEFLPGCDAADQAVLAPVLDGASDVEVAVLRLGMAMVNLVTVAAQSRPVLLVVDDAHWLDDVSAEVLGAVGRRLANPRVGIVAVRRAQHVSAFPAAGWGELPVAPLGAEESAELLERAGVALTPMNRSTILTAAAGNPLALTELPRNADQIGAALETLPLTERLVTVFGARLGQLATEVRAALLRAALDGIKGGAPVASRARYVMQSAEPAVEAGLLVVDPSGQFVFRHPLVRAAVVAQSSGQEIRHAHRDLAELYDDVLVRRASHLVAAATGPDQDLADVLAEAAWLSVRRGGMGAAVEWLRRAADLSSNPRRRTELSGEAVIVALRGGRLNEVQDLLDTVQSSEDESPLEVLANAFRTFHADGEVVFNHRRLLNLLGRAETLDTGSVNQITNPVNMITNLVLAITNFAGDAHMRCQTNAALLALEARVSPAILLYRFGVSEIADTARSMRSVLNDYVELLPELGLQLSMLVSYPAYCVGAMSEFRAPLQMAFNQLSEHGGSIDAIEGGYVVILDLMATGHWEQAEQVGATCLEMAQQAHGSRTVHHQLLAVLGLLAAWRGDLQTARQYAAEVTTWARPRGLSYFLDGARRIDVQVALAEADYEAAYEAAIEISAPGHFPRHVIAVFDDMLDLVEAALLSGHRDEARAHVGEAVRLNLAEVSPRVAALVLAISAMTAPDAEAYELYQSALEHPGIVEFPFDRARIALAQGMWLRRKLRHTEARAALQVAAEGFHRLGANTWAGRAQAELRATDNSLNHSLGETDALTAQEQRIAELAATGSTTKDIAVQLALSPRTVEAHLRRVFRKLGITRRAALSDALRQHDPVTSSPLEVGRQPG